MSLLDAFGRFIRPAGTPEVTLMLCPRCEKPLDHNHDEKECSRQGVTRRFFFGLLGASSAALALRLEGVPIPTAHHMVIAHSGDYVRVKASGGPFAIAWDRPRNDKQTRRYDEMGGAIPASDLQKFMPNDAEKIFVSAGLLEMRIVSVVDENTRQPLEFRVMRAEGVQKERQAQDAMRRKQQADAEAHRLRQSEMRRVPRGLEAFLRVPIQGDFVRRGGYVWDAAEGGDARVCYRSLPGWEMVYSYITDGYGPEKTLPPALRRLKGSKWGKHPLVQTLIDRERLNPRRIVPRLPA